MGARVQLALTAFIARLPIALLFYSILPCMASVRPCSCFEDMLVKEFGPDMALSDQIGVALQFSVLRPKQQEEHLLCKEGARRSSSSPHLHLNWRIRVADLSPSILRKWKNSEELLVIRENSSSRTK